MVKVSCEYVCIAALAIDDCEEPLIERNQVESHLANCAKCRMQIEQLLSMKNLLDLQRRRKPAETVWPEIERTLSVRPASTTNQLGSGWFLLVGLLLFGYKIVLMLPSSALGLWFKFVPVLLVIAVFSYTKQNPFKINTELKLEGE